MKLNFCMIILVFILQSCFFIGMDKPDDRIKVENKSNLDIGVFLNTEYPDTSLINAEQRSFVKSMHNESLEVFFDWDFHFKKHKKVTVFIVNWNDVVKYYWGKNNISEMAVLKKIELSKSNLDSINWIINFP